MVANRNRTDESKRKRSAFKSPLSSPKQYSRNKIERISSRTSCSGETSPRVKSSVHIANRRSPDRRNYQFKPRVESYAKGLPYKLREDHRKFNVKGAPPCASICIFGIGPNEGEADLFRIFKEFGYIKSVVVARWQNGQSRGFAYVHYKSTHEAEKAKREMSSAAIHGFRVRIEFSKRGPDNSRH